MKMITVISKVSFYVGIGPFYVGIRVTNVRGNFPYLVGNFFLQYVVKKKLFWKV